MRYLVISIVVLWMVVTVGFVARTVWFLGTLLYAGLRHLVDDWRKGEGERDD